MRTQRHAEEQAHKHPLRHIAAVNTRAAANGAGGNNVLPKNLDSVQVGEQRAPSARAGHAPALAVWVRTLLRYTPLRPPAARDAGVLGRWGWGPWCCPKRQDAPRGGGIVLVFMHDDTVKLHPCF